MLASLPFANGSSMRGSPRARVDLFGLLILAEVVVGHGEIERRLRIIGIDVKRLFECLLRLRKPALVMIDDAEHVEDVRVAACSARYFREQALGLVVFSALVMVAAELDQLTDV